MSISRTSVTPKSQKIGYSNEHPIYFGNCITRAILKLVAVAESGAYSKYVSIYAASQMPKEPC